MTLAELKTYLQGGEWVSLAVELRPQEDRTGSGIVQPFYVKRVFRYEPEDKFTGIIYSYADVQGQIPLVKFEFVGHINWPGPHEVAPGAQKIDYILDSGFFVTPLNDAFASLLNSLPVEGIGEWKKDETQNILKKRFPLFNISEGQVVADYDLIYIYNDMLFMGAKHVDGTPFDKPENRPHLLQIPLVRHVTASGL